MQPFYVTVDGSRLYPYPNAAQYWAKDATLALFEEVVGSLSVPAGASRSELEIDMGRPIAKATVLATGMINPNVPTQFVQRPERKGPSRVVVLPEDQVPDVQTLVIVLQQKFGWVEGEKEFVPGEYLIVTVYPGVITPNEPCNTKPNTPERDRSLLFWCSHALVHQDAWGSPFVSSFADVLEQHDRLNPVT